MSPLQSTALLFLIAACLLLTIRFSYITYQNEDDKRPILTGISHSSNLRRIVCTFISVFTLLSCWISTGDTDKYLKGHPFFWASSSLFFMVWTVRKKSSWRFLGFLLSSLSFPLLLLLPTESEMLPGFSLITAMVMVFLPDDVV